jgi:hypothetical protein
MLLVGVDGDGVRTADAHVVQAIDGVVTGTTTADDDDSGVTEPLGLLHLFFLLFVPDQSLVDDVLHR